MAQMTIAATVPGWNAGILKATVCASTSKITYADNQTMVKAAICDGADSIAVLCFVESFNDQLLKAADMKHTLKMRNFSKQKDGCLVINKRTVASILAVASKLSREDINEARYSMYAPVCRITDALKTDNKSRVSIVATVKKVYPAPSHIAPLKLVLTDTVDSSEGSIVLWSPHNAMTVAAGQCFKIFDAKTVVRNGERYLNATENSHIEVEDIEATATTSVGTIIGLGMDDGHLTIEFVKEGNSEEDTLEIDESVDVELLQLTTLPVDCEITLLGEKVVSIDYKDIVSS